MKTMLAVIVLLQLSCAAGKPDLAAFLLLPAERSFLFTSPDDALTRPAPRDRIADSIRRARSRIVMYCYDLDEAEILSALGDAAARGVRVQITGSPDHTYTEAFEKGLSVHIRPSSGLQHAKVLLIDDELFIAGTGNFSESDLFHNNNAFLFYNLPKEAMRAIEDSLLREAEDSPAVRGLPFQSRLLVSPARGRLIQSVLVESVLSARSSIRYLIYSHSDPVLTDALLAAAARGVLVEGVYDQGSLGPDSEGALLSDALSIYPGVIYEDGNRNVFERDGVIRGGKLHHKTMIIDDSIVLTGSFNFSMNARDTNQEIFLRIEDPWAAMLFRDEFDRIANRARPLGRSPALPAVPLLTGPDPYCSDSLGRLTVFYGQGPSFGADHFETEKPCAFIKDRTVHSAGIAAGKTAVLEHRSEMRVHHMTAGTGILEPVLPDGEALDLRGMTKTSIWPGLADCTEIKLFGRDGLTSRMLQKAADGFYTFPSIPSSDTLVWLECGKPRMGCAKTGATIDRALQTYLDAMEWEGRKPPVCVNLE